MTARISNAVDVVLGREKRQVDETDGDARATAIANAIAQQQGWDAESLDWYAYADSSNSTHLTLILLLGDKRGLRNARNESTLPFSQTEALTGLVDAIESGQLGDLSTKYGNAHMKELRACTDIGCMQPYLTAASGKPDQIPLVAMAVAATMLRYAY